MSGRVSRALVAAGAATALVLALPAAGWSDETVVVRGTAFPTAAARIAHIGCTDLFDRRGEQLRPYIGRGPRTAPSGARSLGYDTLGGTAVGTQVLVPSVSRTTTASLAVFARHGAQGLAVAGYQEPADAGTPLMWFGTAPVAVAPGAWTTVEATPLAYTWTKYDMASRTPLTPPSVGVTATVAEVTAAHGDGPGLFAVTFGCDGAPFSMDTPRVGTTAGVTTYDIEGLATAVAISGSATRVQQGDEVTIRGSLRSSTGETISPATMILERRLSSGGGWENLRVVPAGDVAVARINPGATAVYRWRFVDRPLAEGSVSDELVVTVATGDDPEPDDPTDDPADDPTDDPTDEPTDEPTPSPAEPPTQPSTPTVPALPEPTDTASPSPTPVPSPSPTPVPSPTAAQTPPATAPPSPPPPTDAASASA